MTIEAAKPIYYSTRLRLTAEQREQLKEAYNLTTDSSESTSTPEPKRSSDRLIGDIAMKNLLFTRESIPINVILRLQTRLGVEVISRNELIESFIEYLDYIFSPTFLNYDKADRV